jgi:hypothetical protein
VEACDSEEIRWNFKIFNVREEERTFFTADMTRKKSVFEKEVISHLRPSGLSNVHAIIRCSDERCAGRNGLIGVVLCSFAAFQMLMTRRRIFAALVRPLIKSFLAVT